MPWVLFDDKLEAEQFCSCPNINCQCNENSAFLTKDDALILSRYIRSSYEKLLVTRLYKKNFCGFLHTEKSNAVLSFCISHAQKSKFLENQLYTDICKLLETAERVVIRGAINFSLLNYKKTLHRVIEQGIEEYFVEYEKNSFLELLRYFVSIQTSTHRLVHIIAKFDQISVLDDRFEEICFYNSPETYGTLISDFSTEEERILSTLITIAPKKIILHDSSNLFQKNFVQTLESVFKERFFVCNGCVNCKNST